LTGLAEGRIQGGVMPARRLASGRRNDMKSTPSIPLELEVKEIENRTKPGCNSSSTSRLCTCPVVATVKA
jgi:hypothetical protein